MITYLCAKMLDELIVAVVVSLLLSCILFYGVRFPGDLVLFWLVYLVTLSVGIGAAHAAQPEAWGVVLRFARSSLKGGPASGHMYAAGTFRCSRCLREGYVRGRTGISVCAKMGVPGCAVLAYTVAACAPNMDVANVALPCFVVTQLFFLGFLIRQPNMPVYWRYWAPYLDFMRYAFYALMTNEFEGRPDVLLNGVPVLEFYNITNSKWAYLGYESLFFFGFFCLAFLVRVPSPDYAT